MSRTSLLICEISLTRFVLFILFPFASRPVMISYSKDINFLRLSYVKSVMVLLVSSMWM